MGGGGTTPPKLRFVLIYLAIPIMRWIRLFSHRDVKLAYFVIMILARDNTTSLRFMFWSICKSSHGAWFVNFDVLILNVDDLIHIAICIAICQRWCRLYTTFGIWSIIWTASCILWANYVCHVDHTRRCSHHLLNPCLCIWAWPPYEEACPAHTFKQYLLIGVV